MKNNRIIINATCDSERPSGVGIFNRELTKHLISINPDLFTVYETIDFLPDFKNKKVFSNALSAGKGTKGHFLRWLWEQTLMNFSNCELIFTPVPEGPLFFPNKTMVIHDILAIRYPKYYPRQKYYYRFILPLLLRTSKMLFFDSESAREEVYKYYNIKNIPYRVIYPGYDHELFTPQAKGYIESKYGLSNFFLFVGEMRPYKNVMNAIHAFQKSDISNYKFVIAGRKDKTFYPEVNDFVRDLEVQDRVIFLDYVPLSDLPYFYSDASALVFTSEYEGFGLPPLEAMACGAPVITTQLTSLPEVCGNAALYVDPKNVEDISDSMIRIATDSMLRESLRSKSLERAKLFSWEKCASEYYESLNSLLE